MHDLKNRLRFASYYVRFRTDVLIGRHRTSRPIGIRWRWKQWKHGYRPD